MVRSFDSLISSQCPSAFSPYSQGILGNCYHTPDLCSSFPVLSKNMKSMRKQAPSITAFIFTSRSRGNWIPKLSASVKASLTKPDHCLEILPTTDSSSRDLSSKSMSEQQLHTTHGPTTFRTSCLFSFWRVNFGRHGCQV